MNIKNRPKLERFNGWIKLVRVTGIEPAYHALKVHCKTILLHSHLKWYPDEDLHPSYHTHLKQPWERF